jgi:large subunit ribosomal protein L13
VDADEPGSRQTGKQGCFYLMGKHKPSYTPFIDTGDHVVVINAAKVKLTGGRKRKVYRHFTGYPGGLSKWGRAGTGQPADRMVEDAIFGMLPKTKMGKQMYRNCKCTPAISIRTRPRSRWR